MQIQLRFFAAIRETLGVAEETLTLPEQVRSVTTLRDFLRQRGGAWSLALAEQQPLRIAFNHTMIDADQALIDGCEIAFFPPVTGG